MSNPRVDILEMGYFHPDHRAYVALAKRDSGGEWEFTISPSVMASGTIDETCRRQTLRVASDAQAREVLDRLGCAVVVASNWKQATADALRKAVMESTTEAPDEAPESPVEVDVPTGIGAVVSFGSRPDVPGYVLTREGWLGLNSWTHYGPAHIADLLRRGARVLFEGVEE